MNMASTSLQHATRYRRQAARQRAWIDGNYRSVGYLDARLSKGETDNPYPKNSARAVVWLEGYREGAAEVKAAWLPHAAGGKG